MLRLIEQLGAVLRRLVEQLGLGAPAAAEVIREARAAQGELLGPLADALTHVDPETAVSLLRQPQRARLWIEFLRVEAAAHRLRGDEGPATALEARASALAEVVDRVFPAT